jgi:hypothetical protein
MKLYYSICMMQLHAELNAYCFPVLKAILNLQRQWRFPRALNPSLIASLFPLPTTA